MIAAAACVGLALMADGVGRNSATYDEVEYLKIAARWLRTGDQEEITRMGSPLTFWKWQQAPVLWLLDRWDRSAWVDDPERYQVELLPWVRLWSLHVWLIAWGTTVLWAKQMHGPRAAVLAAWLFTLSPNLLAHGGLITMETPITACAVLASFAFWRFLRDPQPRFGFGRWFWISAAASGLAFSCKFTAILFPILFGAAWWLIEVRELAIAQRAAKADDPNPTRGLIPLPLRILTSRTIRIAAIMTAYVAAMLAADWLITGGAMLTPSKTAGAHLVSQRLPESLRGWFATIAETPMPQDWVGFAIQSNHQRSGGPSYLFGERRMTGWRHYYLVALAVKVPLGFWLLAATRAVIRPTRPGRGDALPILTAGLFLLAASAGSTRNYGVRYLLPMAPLAIVWVSSLAESAASIQRRGLRAIIGLSLLSQSLAVASIHPYELSYFNILAQGPIGGRRILADSNLDWGQGAKGLAAMQRQRPEFRDLTLYYFGDTDPRRYGVVGEVHAINAHGPLADTPKLPDRLQARSRFLAVSASLQWGPWGPNGYFDALRGAEPMAYSPDFTIAVYDAAKLLELAP